MSMIDLNQEAIRWTGDFGKDIPGASLLAGAKGQVDLFQASYNTGNAGRLQMGGQMRPGTIVYGDIAVSKPNSAATPKLMATHGSTNPIPVITIYQYTRDSKNVPVVAESWKLEKCFITNYAPGPVGGIDSFMIDYEIITVESFELTEDGTLKPSGTRGYNRQTHEAF